MPLYEMAFVVAIVLLGALAFMQERLRRQIHGVRFGNQEINPWSLRFSNNFLGAYGIWKLHKRFHTQSGIRSSFVAVLIVFVVSVIVGVCDLLYHGR